MELQSHIVPALFQMQGPPEIERIVSVSASAEILVNHELGVSDGSRTPPNDTFSTLSAFHSIASTCKEVVPGWKEAIGDRDLSQAVEIKQMVEGLSNQLFRVSLRGGSKASSFRTVLYRIYGEHVSSFYNPDHELRVFKTLSAIGIGPKMVANGPGWRIEEFHEDSAPLLVRSLQNPSTFAQIASILGRLHKVNKHVKFPTSEFPHASKSIAFERLDSWVREGLAALDRLPSGAAIRERLRIDEILPLVGKMKEVLTEAAENPNVAGNEIVFCHNDAQENNILITPYGLRMIDFEYADFNFQFSDIGNMFNEFTMDYLWPEAPYFKGTPSDYPALQARRMFVSIYLSEYLERPVMDHPDEGGHMIDQLLEGAEIGSQLSHILWGFWSLVRAQQQAEGGTSFDFVSYAQFRFDEFLAKKITLGW
jgi:choline kinase